MEILKCYDIIYQTLKHNKSFLSQLNTMAELYKDKIMFFLVHRRYNEADYCVKIYKELSIKKLTIENIAFLLQKYSLKEEFIKF